MGRRAAPGSDHRECHKGNQCPRRNTCRFQHPPDEPVKGLGRLWQFPSDHLPVGAVLEDGLRVVSWNVMDSSLIGGVLAMGLRNSMLTQQNVPVGLGALTWRDSTVLMTILSWLGAPTPRPVAILALQECSADFLRVLTTKLQYGPYKRADSSSHGDAVLIYHSDILKLTNMSMHEHAKSPFTSRHGGSGKPLAVATFERASGPLKGAPGLLRVVAGKVPGNPSGVHLDQYCAFLQQLFSRCSMRTIALGDFNFLETEVLAALRQVQLIQWDGVVAPSVGRYPTNIQPEGDDIPCDFGGGPLAPKRIDHVLQLGGSGLHHLCGLLPPEEVMPGLQRVVDMMTRKAAVSGPQQVTRAIWEEVMHPDGCRQFMSDKGPPDLEVKTSYATAAVTKGEGAAHVQNNLPCPSPSVWVADEAKVTRELARVALGRPEVAFSPSREAAAVEWLLHQDLNQIAELLRSDTEAPLTSPGPYRKSPFSSPWGSPAMTPEVSPGASPQGSPGASPNMSPGFGPRPAPLSISKDRPSFALDIVTPTTPQVLAASKAKVEPFLNSPQRSEVGVAAMSPRRLQSPKASLAYPKPRSPMVQNGKPGIGFPSPRSPMVQNGKPPRSPALAVPNGKQGIGFPSPRSPMVQNGPQWKIKWGSFPSPK